MVNKMPGYQVDKYANLRVGYTFMFGHSGKKLLFMPVKFRQAMGIRGKMRRHPVHEASGRKGRFLQLPRICGHMELPQPEQHIGNQEILHLRLAVIENLGAWRNI